MNKNSVEYQKGFRDGFCSAMNIIKKDTIFHRTEYLKVYNMLKIGKEEG